MENSMRYLIAFLILLFTASTAGAYYYVPVSEILYGATWCSTTYESNYCSSIGSSYTTGTISQSCPAPATHYRDIGCGYVTATCTELNGQKVSQKYRCSEQVDVCPPCTAPGPYNECVVNLTHCSNGVQDVNQGETGVDCGGCCPNPCGSPPPPASCSNNTADNGETGIDCGGPCTGVQCVSLCPSGTTLFHVDQENIDVCVALVAQDQFGNCPGGYPIKTTVTACPPGGCSGGFTTGDKVCAFDAGDSVLGKSDYIPPTVELPPSWSTGPLNTLNQSSNTTVNIVDNGNGTSTTTSTTITTNPDTGASSTTTTSNTYNNSTSTIISSSTITNGTDTSTNNQSIEDNPQNYNFNFPLPTTNADDSDSSIPPGIVPDQNELGSFLDDLIGGEISAIITDSGVQTSSPVCSITADVFSTTVNLDFCNDTITDALDSLGVVLVSITYLVAIFLIFS